VPTDVSGLTAAILDAATPICEEAAQLMGNDIDLTAPVDEGELVASRQIDTQPSGSGAVSTLRYTAEHASFQDEGTGPHTIEGNPLLSFNWNGQQVIVHSVEHPGSVKNKGWFSDKANDESLWQLQVQAVLSGYVIF
jgi:hypothetical protein